jgi:peptide/nickel transport system substrate-binding protein
MKKIWLMLFTLLFVICFAFSNSEAAPQGTLRIANSTNASGFTYESTDGIFWQSFWGWALYDPLLTFDNKANPVGVVAQSWTVSPDGLTWTFIIRKGIKFHNGDPLTAHDVKFSVDRFASKESTNPWSPYLLKNYASTEVKDNYTFVYKCLKPEPFLYLPFSYVQILPKNYFEKVGQVEFRKNPVGSGPYKFVKLVHATSFEMEANTNYWGKMPAFKTVIDLLVPEEATRVAMLKSGEIDIATSLNPDRLVELRQLGFKLMENGLNTLANISFPGTWATDSPTADVRVRKAMSYSVNRQEMCDTFFKGLAKPGGRWFIDEGSYAWNPAWKPDPYDVKKAMALLKEAGYPDKFKDPVIKIYTQADIRNDLMQMLQGYWQAVGIQSKINIVDGIGYAGLFFKNSRTPGAQNFGSVIPWVYPNFVNGVYHTANMFTSKGVHATGNDPKADTLYNKAVNELNPVKAGKYYQEFQEYAYNMWVNVGILKQPSYIVVGPNVGDCTNSKIMGTYYMLSGFQHPKNLKNK